MVRPVDAGQGSWWHTALVAVGAAAYGAITVGGRVFAQRGFSLYEIALIGALFGSAALAPLVLTRPALRPRRRDLDIFVAYGLAGATLQITQFTGVVLGVPIAIVALLLYTQPVWTVLLGRLLLNEPITARKLVALALAAAGTFVLIGPTEAQGHSPLGLGAALVAGVMLSAWVILARMSALRGNHPLTTSFGYHGSSTVVLLAAWPLLRGFLGEHARIDPGMYLASWALIAVYTLVVNVGPNLLVMWGMREVDASTAGMLLLLEPVAAGLLAWVLFGEAIGGHVWAGGALILAANAVLLRRRRGRSRSS